VFNQIPTGVGGLFQPEVTSPLASSMQRFLYKIISGGLKNGKNS
jgi:hypothetical protein